MKAKKMWHWFAWGKHPVAKDFFTIGRAQPIFSAFCSWVEKGFQVAAREGFDGSACSWRFWARGSQKHALVCGLLKNGCDLLGRPYPFLILGTGSLDGWPDHWDLLPMACDQTWKHLEYLAVKRYETLDELRQELHLTRAPAPRWKELLASRNDRLTADPMGGSRALDASVGEVEGAFKGFAKGKGMLVPLETGKGQNLLTLIDSVHHQMKAGGTSKPNAVFMGGGLERSYLAGFQRGLRTDDFSQLWLACSENIKVSFF